MKRIGILGGAFDPVTLAHIDIALAVLNRGLCDLIWLMPCYSHSFDKKMSPPQDRLKMCEIAIEESKNRHYGRIIPSYYEIDRKLPGQTYFFVKSLLSNKISFSVSMIVGQDNADNFDKWYKFQELQKMIPFIVIPRGTTKADSDQWYTKPPHHFVKNVPPMVCSSTLIREVLKIQKPEKFPLYLKNFLSKPIFEYIKEKGLYGYDKTE